MGKPLVSVITPTWKRRDLLLQRALPSVAAQDYPNIEHIVVSDGPDLELEETFRRFPARNVHFFQLPRHDPERHWGAPTRRMGIEESDGEYICYVDDDDSLHPDHVSSLVQALEDDPDAGFARSWMAIYDRAGQLGVIGPGQPTCGNISTQMLMHRRRMVDIANWDTSPIEDYELVRAWLAAGERWAAVEKVTVDAWPSGYHGW